MDAVQVFNQDFPDDLRVELVRGLQACYVDADRLVTGACVDEHVRENFRPWARRQLIEDFILSLKGRFRDVQVENVGGDGFWWHAEIRFGRVVLTVSAGVDDSAPLRPAEYKVKLARGSQKLLFEGSHDPQDSPLLYAVLLHNRKARTGYRLGFATVRFPKADHLGNLTQYFIGEVDLYDGFDESDDDVAGMTPEVIVKESPAPAIRRGG